MRTRPVTRGEYRKLLRLLRPDIAIAARIAANTGLRVSDVLRLRVGDLKRTMSVSEQKTRKVRTVRLSDSTYRAAKAYAKQAGLQSSDLLVPLNRSTVYRHIRKTAEGLNLKHVSMHSFRKYFAYMFAKKNGMTAAQEELRHTYLSTTLLYLVDTDKFLNNF